MFLGLAMLMLPALLLISDVSAQCLTGNDYPDTMSVNGKQDLTNARFGFALESLKKVATIQPHGNIFFSPHSLHQALTLAYFGSRGTTEEALRKALHIPNDLSKVDVQRYYASENLKKQQQSVENASSSYEYTSANRMWISQAKKIRECIFDFLGDQLEKVDFATDPLAVRNRINDWVSNVTKGHIRDLLPVDAIGADSDLVLANAVYFKGLWQSRFDPANSKRDLFYASGSQNGVVTYMRQKRSLNHMVSEELGAHVLELPYKGNQVSMFVLLPPFATDRALGNEWDGVRQLVERMHTQRGSEELREILDGGMPPREVEVSLPRFQIEKELPMGPYLSAMGAGELMQPNVADLRGFVADGEESPHLGDAIHRARIEVTEEGTTAVAATAIFSFRSSRPSEPAIFNANHPFVYFIYDRPSSTILFCGVYRIPPQSSATTEA